MANDDYYGRLEEANRPPAADLHEEASRAEYHRLLAIAARDRKAYHERLHDAVRERRVAEREERQRAQSLMWQQIVNRPGARTSAAGRQRTTVVVAGFALAALGIWAAAKLQQRRPER
jgi:hypothetical protein